MAKYRWINTERLANAVREMTVNGVRVVVGLSPYSVPERVSGQYQPDPGLFVISFEYIDEEPAAKRPLRVNEVEIREGAYSGKILSITLPIDEPPLSNTCIIELQTHVLDALRARSREVAGKTDQELNQQVAEEVIEHDLPELVEAN